MKFTKKPLEYGEYLAKLYPEFNIEKIEKTGVAASKRSIVRSITFQVTDSCSLACTYCYQIHKGKRKNPRGDS